MVFRFQSRQATAPLHGRVSALCASSSVAPNEKKRLRQTSEIREHEEETKNGSRSLFQLAAGGCAKRLHHLGEYTHYPGIIQHGLQCESAFDELALRYGIRTM